MAKKPKIVIHRGGIDTERLYLSNLTFKMQSGEQVSVEKSRSALKNYSMEDHIARHKGRYAILGLFCRPGQSVLDFPCGSGYAAEFLKPFSIRYHGIEFDPVSVEYARMLYGNKDTRFDIGDLQNPDLEPETYDIAACIEGIEHIDQRFQSPLVRALADATKPGGVVIVSSPVNPTGTSGPSVHNKDHKWELTEKDFVAILRDSFDTSNIELITQTSLLSTGVTTKCLYAVCHKN